MRQQLEQALSADGSGHLIPVDSVGACRFLLATADHIFTHDLVLAFLNGLRRWARENVEAQHASTPQIHVYVEGCRRDLAPDAIQARWHYLYSLTRGEAASIRLLGKDNLRKKRFWIALSRINNVQLRFNQLLVHETRQAYGLDCRNHATKPLDGAILLHGYLW